MSLMSKDVYRKIKEREKKATKGPWRFCDHDVKFGEREEEFNTIESHDSPRIPIIRRKEQKYTTVLELDREFEMTQSDRDFLVHSKTDMYLLVKEVDHLMSEINAMSNALHFYANGKQDEGRRAKTALRLDD